MIIVLPKGPTLPNINSRLCNTIVKLNSIFNKSCNLLCQSFVVLLLLLFGFDSAPGKFIYKAHKKYISRPSNDGDRNKKVFYYLDFIKHYCLLNIYHNEVNFLVFNGIVCRRHGFLLLRMEEF